MGIGVETADMLVQEVLSRNMRDPARRSALCRLTGSPDESGAKRRDKGLARSGNARVRRGMIQLAWRFLWLQKDSALAEWYRQRTQTAPATRKTLIVAPARKLLIALGASCTTASCPRASRCGQYEPSSRHSASVTPTSSNLSRVMEAR